MAQTAVFCALGTTRGVAGFAAAFKHVDLDCVAATAKAAKEAGSVKYFGLVSAQGASTAYPSSDWALLHPLLYTKQGVGGGSGQSLCLFVRGDLQA